MPPRPIPLACLAFVTWMLPATTRAEVEPWPQIRQELFGETTILEEGAPFLLFAPAQAADAATVPIDIRFPAHVASKVKKLSLIVDRNPVPIAATFVFDDAYRVPNIGERSLSTRVRIDGFTDVRAVLETTDGQLFMIATPVAAAGGCSAPASKDPDNQLPEIGKMIVRSAKSAQHDAVWRDGTIMIRHPNFTGMQIDATTNSITPARYIDRLDVRLENKPLFSMLGGISISENPNLRFTFGKPTPNDLLSVKASDTDNTTFIGMERREAD